MSYSPYCRPHYNNSYPCDLLWWQDSRYHPYCYYPPRTPLRRSYSFDSSLGTAYKPRKPRHDHTVNIFLNIRYKHTHNRDTLLCEQVCVEMNPCSRVMDVWRAAKRCNPYLRQFQPTEKVLITDSRQTCFTEICSHSRIKDEYHKGERHWVFVVYLPDNCKPNDDKNARDTKQQKPKKDKKKPSKKKPSNFSCSCGCC